MMPAHLPARRSLPAMAKPASPAKLVSRLFEGEAARVEPRVLEA